ncbi:MAG TPA: helix-turn-helix domain-containing protein [Candidatus Binatia bacterium]|nr:helix-turn-helix domain-containing protein [Candidatus Binatia bacterium]
MGTRERRQRQIVDREQLFLSAARELIREEGLLKLQMSRLAERCEYAVGTLYQHFASKEDLLVALVTQSVREHAGLFERVGRWKAGTRERMFGIGVADMIFVRRNPDHFRLAQYALCEVVWQAASAQRREQLLQANKPVAGVVTGIVEEAVRAGDLALRGQTPQELTTGLWSLAFGFHNLAHAEGVLEDFTVHEPYRVMCRHMQHLLNGCGWQPLADPSDTRALERLIRRVSDEVFGDLCEDRARPARRAAARASRREKEAWT